MKKIILVCTMLSASQMFGMEPEQKPEFWNLLPKEVQALVIQALYTNDNPNEAINGIIAMSQTNKALHQLIHGDIKSFTALMNLLAKKFPLGTRKDIAEKFNTATAQQYVEINSRLLKAIQSGDLGVIKKLITQEKADPNFTSYQKNTLGSSLSLHVPKIVIGNAIYMRKNAKEILQFLLENGMSPEYGLSEVNTTYNRPAPEDIQELLNQYKDR